jgi:hypothetical protein
MEGYDYKLAYDYTEMFRGLLADYPYFSRHVKEEIGWAKQHLRKRDRITWYLRWIRLYDYNAVATGLFTNTPQYQQVHGPAKPFDLQMVDKYEQLVRKESAKLGHASAPILSRELVESHARKQELLDHYLGLPVPEIQNLVWDRQAPSYLFATFHDMEAQWKEETRGVLQPRPGDRPAITFGDGWAWWMLDRGYCEEEARAMGHCGNIAGQYNEDQRILSLRQSVRRGSEEYYEPHLTFVLDTRDSSLGEMKGKGNAKPTARYHPYIVKLLESDVVSKVKGGGYLPENNFKLSDLPQKEQDRLVQQKPSLMSFAYRLGKEGETKAFVRDLTRTLGRKGEKDSWYMPKRHGFLINSYTLKEFLEEFGDEDSQGAADVLEGRASISTGIGEDEGYWAGWGGKKGVSPLEDTLSAMGMTTLMMAEKYYRGLAAEVPYDQVRRSSAGPVDGILKFISQNRLVAESNAIAEAWKEGRKAGAMASMRKELDSALDSVLGRRLEDGTIFYRPDPGAWNSDIEHILPTEEAAAIADQGQTFDEYFEGWDQDVWTPTVEFDVPPQGWPGWGYWAAEAALREHYSHGQEEEPRRETRKRRKSSPEGR